MNKFETVILYSPVLTTSDQKKQEDSFKNQLSKVNGTIISQENWGLKDLSYNIKNNKKHYIHITKQKWKVVKFKKLKKI